ncbi:hypothetical protein SeMB42_g07805 [Synchytrium endobioticum]|uniref:Uncharacterized protein n=1 Tax=Synchytrium endobioticum TaxID=286115 RepID=A0A507BZI7_9FUNG|nr:hypothetical protein SeMB42_g07805 [Synchytrium endobioticum]
MAIRRLASLGLEAYGLVSKQIAALCGSSVHWFRGRIPRHQDPACMPSHHSPINTLPSTQYSCDEFQYNSIFDSISTGLRISQRKVHANLSDLMPADAEYELLRKDARVSAPPDILQSVVALAAKTTQDQFNILVKNINISPSDLSSLGSYMCNRRGASCPLGLKILRYASQSGHLHDLYSLATYLAAGNAEQKKEAKSMFEYQAKQGHLGAQFSLGLQLLHDNPTMAVEYLRKAANKGHVYACTTLGALFLIGAKVPQNSDLAKLYLTKAHEKGIVGATYNLSLLYGRKRTLNVEKYTKLCLEAADKGLAPAQHNAACLYFSPGNHEQRMQTLKSSAAYIKKIELWKALQYYKMAATQGFYMSQVNLAQIYLTGYEVGSEKVKADLTQAQYWIEAAERQVGPDHPDIRVLKSHGSSVAD